MYRNLSFIFRAKVSIFWLVYHRQDTSQLLTQIKEIWFQPTYKLLGILSVLVYLAPPKIIILLFFNYQNTSVCSMVTGCVLPQIIILFMYSTIPASRKRKQTIKYGLHAQQCMFLLLHAWHTIHQSIYYLQRKASYHFDIIELYKSKILKNCKLAMSSY